jgi:hypothetical protein
MDSFNEDLKVLDLNYDNDLSVLIDQYENTLKETLQQPCSTKTTNYNSSSFITMVQ